MAFMNTNRMTIRATPNPLDKATIISILPKNIPPERKPTIQPGIFQIPYGTYEKPGLLVVGPSSWWKETDEGMPLLEIPHSALTVAHSIVRDWAVGILACDMADVRPGVFYIPGEITEQDLQKKVEYKALLEQANTRQRRWFEALVNIADQLWARTNGNPLTISDDMKLAASQLVLDRPWMKVSQQVGMVSCKACGQLKNPLFPVCPHCKAIDNPEQAAKLGIVFAK